MLTRLQRIATDHHPAFLRSKSPLLSSPSVPRLFHSPACNAVRSTAGRSFHIRHSAFVILNPPAMTWQRVPGFGNGNCLAALGFGGHRGIYRRQLSPPDLLMLPFSWGPVFDRAPHSRPRKTLPEAGFEPTTSSVAIAVRGALSIELLGMTGGRRCGSTCGAESFAVSLGFPHDCFQQTVHCNFHAFCVPSDSRIAFAHQSGERLSERIFAETRQERQIGQTRWSCQIWALIVHNSQHHRKLRYRFHAWEYPMEGAHKTLRERHKSLREHGGRPFFDHLMWEACGIDALSLKFVHALLISLFSSPCQQIFFAARYFRRFYFYSYSLILFLLAVLGEF
jgi:hypothetical protein